MGAGSRRRARAAAAGLLVVLGAAGGPTSCASQRSSTRAVRVGVENDLIALRGRGAPPDFDYTHGTRVTLEADGAPPWALRLAGGHPPCAAGGPRPATAEWCASSALEVGQQIFTPRIDAPAPVPGQRPYAGWLYASGTLRLAGPARTRAAGVDLGVTGPPALAAPVQNGIHQLLGNARQRGWSHQLAFEPGVRVRYDEAVIRQRAVASRTMAGAAAAYGASLGNVETGARLGALAWLARAPAPGWSPLAPGTAAPPAWYLFARYQQDVVAHALVLDGNSGRPGARAERRPLVGEAQVGAGGRRGRFGVEYRYVVRGREYAAQPRAHAYGALALTVLHRPRGASAP